MIRTFADDHRQLRIGRSEPQPNQLSSHGITCGDHLVARLEDVLDASVFVV